MVNENGIITPTRKLNVFISSKCGVEKYETVRRQIKGLIEATNLADVYLFEDAQAATLPTGQSYLLELQDSDVCIFLIDNADGVPDGVQNEVNCAKKHKIKSLYYFCDEGSQEKTALEKSLNGAQFSKRKTIHSFSELSTNGAQGLIDDILSIYRYYCKDWLEIQNDDLGGDQFNIEISSDDRSFTTPKSVIENIDKSKSYFVKLIAGYDTEAKNTCEYDDWCYRFLPIVFEHSSVQNFNVSLFLEGLASHSSQDYHKVVTLRWNAIQAYYLGNLDDTVVSLEAALALSKELKMPDWIIKDILIDLRNQRSILGESKNTYYFEDPAQKELSESNQALYYPLIDRIHNSFNEKLIENYIKRKEQSPYTMTIGHGIEQYSDYITESFAVAMFNGSLTHLLQVHNHVKTLAFYLCSHFGNWHYKLLLLKESIYRYNDKEIDGLEYAFPDIFTQLNSREADEIFGFCSNIPIEYQRLSAQLLAIKYVGYFMTDDAFSHASTIIIDNVNRWLDSDEPIVILGATIVQSLGAISHRITQEALAAICNKYIDKGLRRFYDDILKLIADQHLDIDRMQEADAKELIERVASLLCDDTIRNNLNQLKRALIILRKKNVILTEELDSLIAEKMPSFYANEYLLETTSDESRDLPVFVEKYISEIVRQNDEQGKNGVFRGYANMPHLTIRSIILHSNCELGLEVLTRVFIASCETIISTTHDIQTKCNAVDLLICLTLRYPELVEQNQEYISEISLKLNNTEYVDIALSMSNLSEIAIQFSACLLCVLWGTESWIKVLELLPYVKDNDSSAIRVCKTVYSLLSDRADARLPIQLEPIILQYLVSQMVSRVNDLRWYAINSLILLLRNQNNKEIIFNQLIHSIDTENIYIKSSILKNTYHNDLVDESTKKYIIQQCANDENFIIRTLCKELSKK